MVLGGFVGGFGWFWVVLDGFGWFWVVPCFSNYVFKVSVCKVRLTGVVTKTRNQPKPPKTTQNHPKPPTKPTKPTKTTQTQLQHTNTTGLRDVCVDGRR